MGHILIVENDADTRDYLALTITQSGHECIACSSAEEARAALDSWALDAALLDIQLPGEHGVSLCWDIRQQFPRMPIFIVSAQLRHWDSDDILHCGATDVFEKPDSVDRLLEAISQRIAS